EAVDRTDRDRGGTRCTKLADDLVHQIGSGLSRFLQQCLVGRHGYRLVGPEAGRDLVDSQYRQRFVFRRSFLDRPLQRESGVGRAVDSYDDSRHRMLLLQGCRHSATAFSESVTQIKAGPQGQTAGAARTLVLRLSSYRRETPQAILGPAGWLARDQL